VTNLPAVADGLLDLAELAVLHKPLRTVFLDRGRRAESEEFADAVTSSMGEATNAILLP
jgi:hypothetical protein